MAESEAWTLSVLGAEDVLRKGTRKMRRLKVLLTRSQRKAIANFKSDFIPHCRCCTTESSTAYGHRNCEHSEQNILAAVMTHFTLAKTRNLLVN